RFVDHRSRDRPEPGAAADPRRAGGGSGRARPGPHHHRPHRRGADRADAAPGRRQRVGAEPAGDARAAAVGGRRSGPAGRLVGGWVLSVNEVKQLLNKQVGPTPATKVRTVLNDVLIKSSSPASAPALVDDPLAGWPGKLFTLARNLVNAAPVIHFDPFDIGL